jgi:predicted XRE-type DNA-binding protein
MTKRRPKVEVGSGNIFADLGLPDAEDMLLKSMIVIELRRLIKQRKLTQTAAAKLIDISQADLSRILRGHFRGYSEAKLMRMLTAFGQDVEITSRPHRTAGEAGRIVFSPQSGGPQTVTRSGRGAVVVAAKQRKRQTKRAGNLAEFFAASPMQGSGATVRRIGGRPRKVDL